MRIESNRTPGLFGKYEGDLIGGRPEGHGRVEYENGNSYEGDWHNGLKEGRGIFSWTDGQKYEGEWKEDYISGEGVLKYPDGAQYEGGFLKGCFNGHGVLIESDGQRYSGNWKNGVLDGSYRVYLPNGLFMDCNEWQNGIHGVVKRNDGERYLYNQGRCMVGRNKDGILVFKWKIYVILHYWENSSYSAELFGIYLHSDEAYKKCDYLKGNNGFYSEKYLTVPVDSPTGLRSGTCYILLQSFMNSSLQPRVRTGATRNAVLPYSRNVDLRTSNRENDYKNNCCWQIIEAPIIGLPEELFE